MLKIFLIPKNIELILKKNFCFKNDVENKSICCYTACFMVNSCIIKLHSTVIIEKFLPLI